IAGVEEVESLYDTHKKSETNQQVSDFYTSAGSVNGSLTDRHYPGWGTAFGWDAIGWLNPCVAAAGRWR
ncbi:hypothetical protein ACEUAT_17395, partial [Aeromonas veronii]